MTTPISGDGMVLVPRDEYENLIHLDERIRMKIRQLESTEFEEFGGIGTGQDISNRAIYVKALRWAIMVGFGDV